MEGRRAGKAGKRARRVVGVWARMRESGEGRGSCGRGRGLRERCGGAYSLGNRKEGAEGWRGCGEPGMWERAQERGRGCGRVARVRGGTGRNAGKGQGLRRLSIRRGK